MPYRKQNSLGNRSNVMQTELLRLAEGWPIVLGVELIDDIKTAILWDVTPCNLVDTYRRWQKPVASFCTFHFSLS